ncbi:MAG: hypothetical protein U1F15_08110 [Burkholderiales bacterium]
MRNAQRESIGRPLAEALHGDDTRHRWSRTHLLVVIGVALALAGLVTAWLLMPAALVLGCAAVVEAARRRALASGAKADGDDDKAVRTLDRHLRETAAMLSEDARASLADVKETLAEALRLVRNPDESAAVSPAERCFVLETVRRYLPDACRHYLALAQVAHGGDREATRTAVEQSLMRQVETLRVRLEQVIANAVAGRAQRVLGHEAFLRGKQRPGSFRP